MMPSTKKRSSQEKRGSAIACRKASPSKGLLGEIGTIANVLVGNQELDEPGIKVIRDCALKSHAVYRFVFGRTVTQGYKNWTAEAILEDLTKIQAEILWCLKGMPQQAAKGQLDDFCAAKRHYGFLLSDEIIASCREHALCPNELLKAEFVPYLRCITVHEYVEHKAYFRSLAEGRDRRHSDRLLRDRDYFSEMDKLSKVMVQCKRDVLKPAEWNEILAYWGGILTGAASCMEPDYVDRIVTAKVNSLSRLSSPNPVQRAHVEYFVRGFYRELLNHISGRKTVSKALVKDAIEWVLRGTHTNTRAITMLEFLPRCALVCGVLPSVG